MPDVQKGLQPEGVPWGAVLTIGALAVSFGLFWDALRRRR